MSKKMFFAMVLTIVLVFAFAGSAFATWGDSTYLTGVSMVPAGAPHKGYTAATTFCGVCHAVHGATGEKLLQSSAGNSCTYCHITSGAYITVYNGQAALYTGVYNTAHGASASGASVTCKDCHTVHGGGTITTTLGSTSNLKAYTAATTFFTAGPRSTYTTTSWNGVAPASFGQWCAGCHPYYNTSFDGKTHVMKNFAADYLGSEGSNPATQVAFATSASCENCHDNDVPANEIAVSAGYAAKPGSAFPHATDGARFLSVALGAGVGATSAATTGDEDGACLKCHANASEGIGKTW